MLPPSQSRCRRCYVGDLVQDVAANKPRDVDITVTLREADGTVRAFKAYEVKREGALLDVATVEQLCMKLRDMPTVTHRAIVSASSFTDGAIAKAAAHDVQLFVLKPWTHPLAGQFPEFKDVGRPDEFLRRFDSNLLCWVDWRLSILAPDGPHSFQCETSPLFASDGHAHKEFPNWAKFMDGLYTGQPKYSSPWSRLKLSLAHSPPSPWRAMMN